MVTQFLIIIYLLEFFWILFKLNAVARNINIKDKRKATKKFKSIVICDYFLLSMLLSAHRSLASVFPFYWTVLWCAVKAVESRVQQWAMLCDVGWYLTTHYNQLKATCNHHCDCSLPFHFVSATQLLPAL